MDLQAKIPEPILRFEVDALDELSQLSTYFLTVRRAERQM